MLVGVLWLLAAQTDFAVLSQRAEQARLSHRPNDAIRLYREAVAVRPSWAEGWWRLGAFLFDQDRFAEAEPALARAVALNSSPLARALLGLCEYEAGELDRSITHFTQWEAAGGPGGSQIPVVARFHWALALNRVGRFEDAERLPAAQARAGDDSPDLIEAEGLTALHAVAAGGIPRSGPRIGVPGGPDRPSHGARRFDGRRG